MLKKKNKLEIIRITIVILMLCFSSHANACDIAIVTALASSDNRPFIWKSRDHSPSYKQQMQYFKATSSDVGGCIFVYEKKGSNSFVCSGGANEAGFSIAQTSVYDGIAYNEAVNANSRICIEALEQCTSIKNFEGLLDIWHKKNPSRSISGNFVVIDALGGAALYECWTGSSVSYSNRISYYKIDANTGIKTYKKKKDDPIEIYEEKKEIGFIVRTNSNTFHDGIGEDRQKRAYELMKKMAEDGQLNYQNFMEKITKEVVNPDIEIDEKTKYNNLKSISRSATRFAMVIEGVKKGDNPHMTTMWCNLGEPSIGVFTPHFPHSKAVSFYAWADKFDKNGFPVDKEGSCFLNDAFDKRETFQKLIYSSNRGSGNSMNDSTINLIELGKIQKWTFPLEKTILNNTKIFKKFLKENNTSLTSKTLFAFSHYCAEYAYTNYINESANHTKWNYSLPVE